MYDTSLWGTSFAADIVATEDGRGIVERVETVAQVIMDSMQDVVMRSLKEQWPMGRSGAAEANAKVVGQELRMWFGDEASPVLECEPIELTELADGAA